MKFEDIFENQNRKTIIKMVLKNPGIHYTELCKGSLLSPGQFQWHLRVLIEYKIIKREKLDNNTIFFPISYSDNVKKRHNFKNIKSEVIFNILDIIESNPGIIQLKISKELGISKALVNYYINRLKKKSLIKTIKSGRELQLFLNKDSQNDIYN